LHLRLAIYGLIAAVLGGLALWLIAPDRWPLMGSRNSELTAAIDAREAGEPPLVGLRAGADGENKRFAVGTTDDQGIYLFAPLLGGLLGADDPADSVKLLWVLLFALAIAAAPSLYRRLLGSTAAAAVAPVALFLAVVSLRMNDIYWVPAWAALALLPPLILLDRHRPSRWLAWVLLLVVAASFASSIRSNAGLPIALGAVFVVTTARVASWRRGLGVLAVVIAYISISVLGLAAVREYRDHHVAGGQLGRGQPTAHPFWHAAYLGLGYLPNDQGIRFRDDIALAHAREETPGVQYPSTEYEHTLRKLTLEFVRSEPLSVAETVGQKLIVVIKDGALYLCPLALLLPFLLLLGDERRERRRMAAFVAPAVLINLLAPLLTIPYYPYKLPYEVGLWGSLNVLTLLAVLWVTSDLEAGRRLGQGLGTTAGRRALACTAAGLILVGASAVTASPIEQRATDWQNSAPPPSAAGNS
jgi:hypothetical protein